MEKYTATYFKSLAKQLRFELTELEAQDIVDEFAILIDQINLLNAIDTQDVKPMIYPFETPTTFLREDVADHVLSAKEALENAPFSRNGFFITKKVVQ